MANLVETDRRWSLTGTLLFHVTIIGLLFLMKCGNGGGGGNGGLGYTGLMSLDAAGLGTYVDGEGFTPFPEPVMEEPTPEAVEEANAITDDASTDAPVVSNNQQSENRKSDAQVLNDNPKKLNVEPRQPDPRFTNAVEQGFKKGQGTTAGTGQQGDPNGSINGRGVLGGGGSTGTGGGTGGGNGTGNGVGSGSGGYELSGRNIIQKPKIDGTTKMAGVVVVDIWVDKLGNVTRAMANPKAKKTNTAEGELFRLAEEAAKRAKFSPNDKLEQKGTITIEFKLN